MGKGVNGYIPLTEKQIEQINEVKDIGLRLGELFDRIESLSSISTVEADRCDRRSLALARTNIQTGIMWGVRAIAKPDGFC